MDICAFHEELISEYARFSRSFTESAWQISSRPPIRLSQAGVLPHPTHPVRGRISKGGGKTTRCFPQKRHSCSYRSDNPICTRTPNRWWSNPAGSLLHPVS